MTVRPVVIGFRSAAREDCLAGIPEAAFEAPKSYTNEEKRKEYSDLSKARFVEEAAFQKLTACVLEISAQELWPGNWQYNATAPAAAADQLVRDFVKALLDVSREWQWSWPDELGSFVQNSPSRTPVLFGFDIRPFVRVCGVIANQQGLSVPLRFWYQNDWCLDPYEMLVEDGRRKYVSLQKVLRQSQLTISDGYEPHQSASQDLSLAAGLVLHYNLGGLARATP